MLGPCLRFSVDYGIAFRLELVHKLLVDNVYFILFELLNFCSKAVVLLIVLDSVPELIRKCSGLIVVLKHLGNIVSHSELLELCSGDFILRLALLHRLLQLLDKLINHTLCL